MYLHCTYAKLIFFMLTFPDQSGAAKHSITLRYLQTLATISGDSSSVVFPLPANVLKFFFKKIPIRSFRKAALNS